MGTGKDLWNEFETLHVKQDYRVWRRCTPKTPCM